MQVIFFFCRTSPPVNHYCTNEATLLFAYTHAEEDATRETHVAVAKRVAKNGPVEELS